MTPDIAPVITVTTNGLTQLQQLGLAGLFLSFIFIGGGWAIWYFAKSCRAHADLNAEAYKEDAKANREVLNGVKDALVGVQITIAKFEGKLEK